MRLPFIHTDRRKDCHVQTRTDEMLETAVRAARRAGEVQIEARRGEIKVNKQYRRDIKLAADVLSEEVIIRTICESFPHHGFLAEESGRSGPDRGPVWVIDPLDGTANFARRIPFFCTSIAAMEGDEPLVGVIYDPVHDELFTVERGKPARLNGEPIHVSHTPTLDRSIVAYGFMKTDEALRVCLEKVNRIGPRCWVTRNIGAAALHLAYVACGRLDGFFEYGLAPWDIAAGRLLITAAGGEVFLKEIGDGYVEITAGNAHIHSDLKKCYLGSA